MSCPRCHHAPPNPNGCAACNPEALGERLKEALLDIKELRADRDSVKTWSVALFAHVCRLTGKNPKDAPREILQIAADHEAKHVAQVADLEAKLSIARMSADLSRALIVEAEGMGHEGRCPWCGAWARTMAPDAERYEPHRSFCAAFSDTPSTLVAVERETMEAVLMALARVKLFGGLPGQEQMYVDAALALLEKVPR